MKRNSLRSLFILCSLWLPLFALFAPRPAHAQSPSRRISGVVVAAESGEPIPFASVRVEGSNRGTTADRQGRFTLALDSAAHVLVATHIGFLAARQTVAAPPSMDRVTLRLRPGPVEFPAVTVTPGDDPAIAIIRQAIEARERRREKLRSYRLTSHSKLVVSVGGMKGISLNGIADSEITAVMETRTDAWWEAPDRYKEVVTARKQTSFIPARSNVMLSSFFVTDFSADDLALSGDGRRIVGPISEEGLRSYDYTLAGETMLDSVRMHVVRIRPRNDADPLLEGTLYISDGTFALAMVDLRLNDAALPTFFTRIAYRQHFALFDGQFWMPTDVIVDAAARVSMIVSADIAIEGLSTLQDYAINERFDDSVFNRTRVQVLKEADERDSAYWQREALIPNSAEELAAYARADSVKTRMDSTRNTYDLASALTGKTLSYGDTRLVLPGLLDCYHFNRVEGHSLAFDVSAGSVLKDRDGYAAALGYSIDTREVSWELGADLRFPELQSLSLGASSSFGIRHIDDGGPWWGRRTTTLSCLLAKYDDKDYYAAREFALRARIDLLRLFPVSVTARRERAESRPLRSNWSLVRPSWRYRDNPAINDGVITGADATVSFDARDFIDNAGSLRRMGARNHVPTVGIGAHRVELDGESWSYRLYTAGLRGSFDLGRAGTLAYQASFAASDARLPTQRLLLVPGSIPWILQSGRFRSVGLREFGGDRCATVSLTQDVGDALFRSLGIPLLKTSGWRLLLFANAGWTDMRADTRALQRSVRTARRPVAEAGFGIDGILLLFRVDVAWRLTQRREGSNVAVAISTPLTN
jgi:hypothetical protein